MYFKEQDMEINRNNYETFFILYLDRELSAPDMLEVEKFLNENTDLRKEFSLFQQTVLIPSPIVFDQKELLFRKEEKRRVIPIFWARIAAAILVLLFGGWLISAQLAKKQNGGLANAGSGKNIIPAKKNSQDQKTDEANGSKTGMQEPALNKIQPAVQQDLSVNKVQPAVQQTLSLNKIQTAAQQNLSVNKIQRAGNRGTIKTKTISGTELTGGNKTEMPLHSADRVHPSSFEDRGESDLTMQKSSVQELPPAESRKNMDATLAAVPGSHSPVTLIAVTGAIETIPHVGDENVVLRENEDQGDNAISVVALNDRNKAVTGFFKKLTKRAPTDEKARKVRVSVFQFSY
jgi:hypothetical protein